MAKDFAKMDKRRGSSTHSVLAQRYDQSRLVPFDADLSKLATNPQNPRYATAKIEEMQRSLKQVGQLQIAVAVTRDAYIEAYPDLEEAVSETASWVVFMGNRRVLAARAAGWDTLKVVLAPDVDSVTAIEDRIIHENIHREEIPPLLLAGLYRRKMDREQLSARALADVLGKTHTHVNNVLALDKLTGGWQHEMQRDALTLSEARVLVRHDHATQDRLYAQRHQLAKLAPSVRDRALAGDLTDADIQRLAALPHSEQRSSIAGRTQAVSAPAGGNSVSTRDLAVPPAGNSVSTEPGPGRQRDSTRPPTSLSGQTPGATPATPASQPTSRPAAEAPKPTTQLSIQMGSAEEIADQLRRQLSPATMRELAALLNR